MSEAGEQCESALVDSAKALETPVFTFTGISPPRRETILLAEDEIFVRQAADDVLELSGYEVLVTGNGMDALEVCRELLQPVDLLLADVIMPGMRGTELAAKFKELYPRGRVLLMSGYAEETTPSGDSSHGYEKRLPKPFSANTLLKAVREALDSCSE